MRIRELALGVVVGAVGLLALLAGLAATLPPEGETATITLWRTATKTVTHTTTQTVEATLTVTRTERAGALWDVKFSPRGGARWTLLYWIGRANESIYVLIYSFTLDDVASALATAKARGVEVKVVMESSQLRVRGGEYPTLVAAGIPVRVYEGRGLMHDKVAIIDGYIVITGSYNWSVSAEQRNIENLIVLFDPELAEIYTEHFNQVWSRST
jgi:hypothetical protein